MTEASATATDTVIAIAPGELQTALAYVNTIKRHFDAIDTAAAGNHGNDERAAKLVAASTDIEMLAVWSLKLYILLHGPDAAQALADGEIAVEEDERDERPEPVGTATTLENFAPGQAVVTEDLRGKGTAVRNVPVQDKGEGAEANTAGAADTNQNTGPDKGKGSGKAKEVTLPVGETENVDTANSKT
jgi:hypothetical protein